MLTVEKSAGTGGVAASSDELEIFNRQELLDRLCGAEDAVETVLRLFVESLNEHLEPLTEAVGRGDLTEVRFRTHSIVGIASNVSAERIRSLAAQLERSARLGSLTGAPELLADLRGAFRDFKSLAITS